MCGADNNILIVAIIVNNVKTIRQNLWKKGKSDKIIKNLCAICEALVMLVNILI
jgi:hypothetical protein